MTTRKSPLLLLALACTASAALASSLPRDAAAAAKAGPLSASERKAAERRLADLGYWAGPVDGVWDEASRHALVAFQKLEGRPATGRLTRAEWQALLAAAPPAARETRDAHLEVDLARQVLLYVDHEGRVANVLPISSGTGKPFYEPRWGHGVAVTPCGRFSVYQKRTGWHESLLGMMHNPMYLVGGIAIHGSHDVPPRPASHGCIRIPMFASQRLTKMVPIDTPVWVYGCPEVEEVIKALADIPQN